MKHKFDKFLIIPATFIIIAIMASIAGATTLSSRLWSFYNLDETSGAIAYDSLGTKNGTDVGLTINQAGKIGRAYSFDGNNDYINFSRNNYTSAYWDNNFSFSVWVNTNTIAAGTDYILWAGNRDFGIWRNGAAIMFRFWDGAAGHQCAAGNLTINTWYHFVGSRDTSSGLACYLNGMANGTDAYTGNGAAATDVTSIGQRAAGTTECWSGLIDEIGFWNRSLTASEASALYNYGYGITYPLEACLPPTSGEWKIVCNNNCTWRTNKNIPGNVSIVGTGVLNLNSFWKFTSVRPYIYISPGCKIIINNRGGFR